MSNSKVMDWGTASDAEITAVLQAEFKRHSESDSEDRADCLDACRALLNDNLPRERMGYFDAEWVSWVSE